MCVFLGRAMKFFFGPSLWGGGRSPPRPPPLDPPLCQTAEIEIDPIAAERRLYGRFFTATRQRIFLRIRYTLFLRRVRNSYERYVM